MDNLGIFGIVLLMSAFGAIAIQLNLNQLDLSYAIVIQYFGVLIISTIISFGLNGVLKAVRLLKRIKLECEFDSRLLIQEIHELSTLSRKEGILAIEPIRKKIKNTYLKDNLKHVIDGYETHTLRDVVDSERNALEERIEYAVDLLKVMSQYGVIAGITLSLLYFVAAIMAIEDSALMLKYTVQAFLSLCMGFIVGGFLFEAMLNRISKMSRRARLQLKIVHSGILGIHEGLNPNFLKEKLEVIENG